MSVFMRCSSVATSASSVTLPIRATMVLLSFMTTFSRKYAHTIATAASNTQTAITSSDATGPARRRPGGEDGRIVESLRTPPIGFAHRGGQAHAPASTLGAFTLALRMGATALESDVWLTADGVVVLDHDGKVGRRPLRRHISSIDRADLPPHIPSLGDLYAECGTGFELSLDIKDPTAAESVVAVARAAGGGAPERLWLCHGDVERLAAWRENPAFAAVHLVNSTHLQDMRRGPERRAAQLAEAGIDAVNLRYPEWTGGLTTLFHRFGRLAFGWDAEHERMIRELVRMGIDGVYSDWVDRLLAVLGPPGPDR
jgi:glycerophosphoryl diester phosphodiesterase